MQRRRKMRIVLTSRLIWKVEAQKRPSPSTCNFAQGIYVLAAIHLSVPVSVSLFLTFTSHLHRSVKKKSTKKKVQYIHPIIFLKTLEWNSVLLHIFRLWAIFNELYQHHCFGYQHRSIILKCKCDVVIIQTT